MGAYLRCMRVEQWLKNLFVFAAPLFAHRLTSSHDLLHAILAFFSFSLLASAIYVINDLFDRERDREHPEKRHRPIASGVVSMAGAIGFAGVLATGAFATAVTVGGSFVWFPGIYVVLNVLYSARLKQVVLLDVFSIAAGFVLRVMSGAFAVDVGISKWFVLCTIFISVFLALCKRRHELLLLGDDAGSHRPILKEYTAIMLDQMVGIVAACTILCYALYTIAPETEARVGTGHLVYTTPFVVFGILRYLFLVHRREGGGNPARLLVRDPQLLATGFGWAALVAWLLYR